MAAKYNELQAVKGSMNTVGPTKRTLKTCRPDDWVSSTKTVSLQIRMAMLAWVLGKLCHSQGCCDASSSHALSHLQDERNNQKRAKAQRDMPVSVSIMNKTEDAALPSNQPCYARSQELQE